MKGDNQQLPAKKQQINREKTERVRYKNNESGGEEMKIWSDQWLEHQAQKLGLKVCYVKIGGAGEGAMKQDEKTAENLERRGKGDYEQDLERVSRRSKTEAGADGREHIRESERDETLQDADAIQVDNTGEIKR